MQQQQLSKATRTVYTILRLIATLVPLIRLHRLQRERGQVADLGGPHRPPAPAAHPPSREVEALLLPPRQHIRGSLWLKKRLLSLLELYGTAGAVIIPRHRVKSPYFQPLLNFANAPNGTADAEMPRNAVS